MRRRRAGVHAAAKEGHLARVNLPAGATGVAMPCNEDRAPLLLASEWNCGEAASALVKAGADQDTSHFKDKGMSHNLLVDSIIEENAGF